MNITNSSTPPNIDSIAINAIFGIVITAFMLTVGIAYFIKRKICKILNNIKYY